MAKAPAGDKDIFNVERIRRLIDLMKEYDLNEIDLRQDEQQIRLVRGAAPAPVPAAAIAASASPVALSSADSQPDDGPHIAVIKSPMVGTFYSKGSPKAEPFVKVGSSVALDTVVCVVEAMKVFNEIPAEVRGKIVSILVENEEPVEFGRPLFKVDTRG